MVQPLTSSLRTTSAKSLSEEDEAVVLPAPVHHLGGDSTGRSSTFIPTLFSDVQKHVDSMRWMPPPPDSPTTVATLPTSPRTVP